MNMEVRFFATLIDCVGASRVALEVDEHATIEDLLAALTQAYPAIEPSLKSVLVSVNQEFAGRDLTIRPGDEVALFPPVSGG